MKPTLNRFTKKLTGAAIAGLLFFGMTAGAYADVAAPLYKPTVVSSFGPNGTHWPSKISTPFMYDVTVPHVIEVECTWAAIKEGIVSVTDDMAAAGVLIRVKPGTLDGKGSGSSESSSNVLADAGKSTWTRRVTVAPRDGIGSVEITDKVARLTRVKGVCFAGFVGKGFMISDCDRSAAAWSKLGFLYFHSGTAAADADWSTFEAVEVVIEPTLSGYTDTSRLFTINATNQFRFLNNKNLTDSAFVACYVTPGFRGTQTSSPATINFENYAGRYENLVFKDMAVFASTAGAFQVTAPNADGITFDNCFVVADTVSLSRYPLPAGAYSNATTAKTALLGRGKNYTVKKSVIAGNIATTAEDAAPATSAFASVTDTVADRALTDVIQTPSTGGWGAPNIGDITSTDDIIDLMPPEPTDAHLYTSPTGIWSVGDAPVITTQPLAPPSAQAGADILLNVEATGKHLVYQWKKDGVAVVGANTATLLLENASAGDSGEYTVTVTNAAGTQTSTAVTVTVTGTSLFRPSVVSSFGPNGTHWPKKISTPFMYDRSVPHIREVECDWDAIRTAINDVTEAEAAEGVILLVKPGELPGKGASAAEPNATNSVIINAGSKTWTRRVTVAPRDGVGTVILGTETTTVSRLVRVNGVCFAGFVGKGFMLSDCSNSAIAWSNIGYLYVTSRADTGLDCANNEFVEVVFDMALLSGNTDRLTHTNNIFPLRFTNNKNYDNTSIEGCYVMPVFQNTGHTAAVWAMAFEKGYPGLHSNVVVKDTAIFAGSGGAFCGNDKLDGLQINHSYIVADPVSTTRYPVPAGTNTAALPAAKKAMTGNGTGYVLVDSVIAGDIDTVATVADTTTPVFATVNNTISDRLYTGAAQVPVTGAWGVPAGTATPAADIIGLMPPDATPAYLYTGASGIWLFAYPAPMIATGLAATTAADSGDDVTLSVTVSADTKLAGYQWTKNGTAITGATSASYTISAATSADSATYAVTVTNAAGSASSSTELTVGGPPVPQPPVITTQPTATVTVTVGTPITLTVVATNPIAGTLSYQWKKGGAVIDDATTATLSLTGVMADSGTYTVDVTNTDGTTTSESASVTVNGGAPTIPTQPPATRTGSTGENMTLTASASGVPAPTYKWQVSTDGGATWNDISLSDPGYTGADTASLTIIAPGTDKNGNQYRYVATNSLGSIESNATTISVGTSTLYVPTVTPSRGPNGTHWPNLIPTPFMYDLTVPHVIEVECSWAAIKEALNSVTDDMAAAGVLIRIKPGALYGNYGGTNTASAVLMNAGSVTWSRRVTVAPRDGFGSVRVEKSETDHSLGLALIAYVDKVCFAGFSSAAFVLRECDGSAVAWSQTGLLNIFNYKAEPTATPPKDAESTSNVEVAEVFVDPAINPSYPTRITHTAALRVYNGGTLNNFKIQGSYIAPVFYLNSNTAPSALNIELVDTTPAPLTENLAIQDTVVFASYKSTLATSALNGLAIDNCYIVSSDVSAARYAIPEGAHYPPPSDPDLPEVYKRAIAGRGQNITINNSDVAGIIKMITGDADKPFSSITNTRVSPMPTGSENLPASGSWTAATSATLITAMPAEPVDASAPATPDSTKIYLRDIWNFPAPVLTSQPPTLTSANAGQNITLSVTVQDPLLIVYQWTRNEVPIAGATQSSYTINSITAEDAGLYAVIVSNGGGTVVATSQVTVGEDPTKPLPIITTQPAANTSELAGTPITLTVVAENPPPATGALTYQWYKAGTAITGATSASLILTGVPDDAGSYTVKVTNANGVRTSAAATVEITGIAAGAAVPLPNALSKLVADSVTLTATTVGNPAPTIKWQYSTDNGTTWIDIPTTDARFTGADTKTLTIVSLALDMDGWVFRYVAENAFGPAYSNGTALEVLTEYPPFYAPTEVKSFGPNGTHWPSLLSTPFMYDVTIPNRIEVECSWAAIKAAIQTVMANESMVSAGTIILVKPGKLPGASANDVVLQNLGSTAWPRRITVAPRDGYGTVQIVKPTDENELGGARINNVHGVCFAGIQANTIRPSGCVNTAIAWTKLGDWLGVTAPAGNNSTNVEIVEVALTDFAVKDSDSAQIAASAGTVTENIQVIGSYFAPRYRASGTTHADTIQITGGQAKDIRFSDTVLFASSNCALQTGAVEGLTIEHCYFAALAPALHRYPYPTGYTPPNPEDVGKPLNGGGSGFKVSDSIFIGRLTGMDGVWAVVQNTRSTASSALASGGVGSWTVDATLAATIPEDFNVPMPTDAYLDGVWKATAPSITTQPVGGILQAGVTHTFSVAVQGTPTFAYQWYKDGVAIPYANDATFTITNLGSANDGTYKVTITNAAGSVTSGEVQLETNIAKVAPAISGNPVATQNAIVGKSVSFSGSATGNPPPAYHWQVSTNGTTWTDIDPTNAAYTGAATDTLTVVNPTAAMNGYKYRYVATNSLGSINSEASTLNVTVAALTLPTGIVSDAAGIFYIADAGAHTIHTLTATGTLQLIAGASGTSGMADGVRTEALLNTPTALAVRSGTLYVADSGNSAIRGVTGSGTVTTIVSPTFGLKNAEGLAVASNGTIYIADTGNSVIRAYSAGTMSVIAGALNTTGTADGSGTAARFNHPTRLALSPAGTMLYVADTGNNAIRVVTPADGHVITIADAADGLFAPSGLLVNGTGTNTIIYIANTGNSTISELDSHLAVTTLAGHGGIDDIAGPPGFKDGVNHDAWFNHPEDITVGTDGALYIADTGNGVVRKLTFDTSDNAVVTTSKTAVKAPEPPPADVGPFNPGNSHAVGGGGASSAWYLALLGAITLLRCAITRRRRS